VDNIRTVSRFFKPNRARLIPNQIRVFFENQTETEPKLKKYSAHP